jgi:alkaline phosphatase
MALVRFSRTTILRRVSVVKRHLKGIGVVMATMFLLCGAAWGASGQTTNNEWKGEQAKYVFLFIGDGMALQQVNAAEIYRGSGSVEGGNANPSIKKLSFTQFPVQGMITTYSSNSFITDSAPAATSLASGYKTDNGVIGMDPGKTKKFTTVAQMARDKGQKVGILTSVSLNHATPASFYASVPSRNDYYGIALQMLDSNFDFFGGGGIHKAKGNKKEEPQPDAYELAASKGYKVVRTREEILALKPGDGKIIAVNPVLDADSAMPYDIDRTDKELSLAEFTKKAIELLDNPKGFFMMVEGGKIDWACHANDAATAIQDTFAFADAVQEAVLFAEKHPNETLIVVVGDHETGGMSIGFAGTQYETFFNKIGFQKESYLAFDKRVADFRKNNAPDKASFDAFFPQITEVFGLTNLPADEAKTLEEKAKGGDKEAKKLLAMNLSELELQQLQDAFARSMKGEQERSKDEQTYLLYGGYEPLTVKTTHILNQKAGIGWTSYAHTGIPVPLFAMGVGAELFLGYYDNTDVAWKTMSILGVKH